jgi:hypothetical protein
MTNEEAIKIISETPVTYANPDEQGLWDEAIHLAISALSHDRWISVEERLPENDCNCIVFSAGYVKESHFYFGKFYDPIEDYMRYKATHWMPLPEPPKEDKQE